VDVGLLHGPAFALRHYTHQRPRDSAAAHLYALICERLGIIDEAAHSLELAASLLEEEFETTESTEVEIKYAIALTNLGRVSLAAGLYEKSLEAYKNAWDLVVDSEEARAGDLKVQVKMGVGLASFWVGLVEESLEAFGESMEEADKKGERGRGEKEEVAVLLSRTLWGLGGDDAREEAKSHLMEWCVLRLAVASRADHILVFRMTIRPSR
jgi:superkiller protein 3